MARKPVTTYAGGIGPRQMIWNAIRSMAHSKRPVFTDLQVIVFVEEAHAVTLHPDTVRDYRKNLIAAGILRVVGSKRVGRHTVHSFELITDEGLDAPRVRRDGSRVTQGLAQEQMWRTLRMTKGDINGRELAAHASTSTVPVVESAAKDYLAHLHAAEYLLCTEAGKGIGCGGKLARYRLIRNTGPKPPMVQKTDAIYDPNLDEVVWVRPVNEETAIYGR